MRAFSFSFFTAESLASSILLSIQYVLRKNDVTAMAGREISFGQIIPTFPTPYV